MYRNEYLQSIKDKDSSLVIGRIMKLKDAPYNKALVLVDSSLNVQSVNNIGGINIVRLQYGSVFLKSGAGLTKLLGRYEENYETNSIPIKYRLIPSHLNIEYMETFQRHNIIIRANKRINVNAKVVLLEEIYLGDEKIIVPKKTIKSAEYLTLPDLMMSDVEIMRSDAREDLKYRFSLNRDLTVKVTPYNGIVKVGISLTLNINWVESPIKDGKHLINLFEDLYYKPYIKNSGLEYRLDNFLRTHIYDYKNEFLENIYELANTDLFKIGILTPRHLASYLLEYLGISSMNELVQEYNEGGITIKTLDRLCEMLPKKLCKYSEVLQDLHRLPNGKTLEDFKSKVFQ